MSSDFPIGFVVGIIVSLIVGLTTIAFFTNTELTNETLFSTMGTFFGAALAVFGSFIVVKIQINATQKAEERKKKAIIYRETYREAELYREFFFMAAVYECKLRQLMALPPKKYGINKDQRILEYVKNFKNFRKMTKEYLIIVDKNCTQFHEKFEERYKNIIKALRCIHLRYQELEQAVAPSGVPGSIDIQAEALLSSIADLRETIKKNTESCEELLQEY